MYEINLERDDCTMCGNCVKVDKEKFTFDDDDRTTLIGSQREDNIDIITVEEAEIYKEAEENCSGECILVLEDD